MRDIAEPGIVCVAGEAGGQGDDLAFGEACIARQAIGFGDAEPEPAIAIHGLCDRAECITGARCIGAASCALSIGVYMLIGLIKIGIAAGAVKAEGTVIVAGGALAIINRASIVCIQRTIIGNGANLTARKAVEIFVDIASEVSAVAGSLRRTLS